MFSGKSEELIRRIRRAKYGKMRVQVFKPMIDDRYHAMAVVSHNGAMEDAIAVDEVQFFDEGIIEVAERLANQGKRMICAGLDQDFRSEPFGATPKLLALAEFTTKLHAICVVCGSPATRTQRLIDGKPAHYHDPVIMVGTSESYQARCRHCHEVPGKQAVLTEETCDV